MKAIWKGEDDVFCLRYGKVYEILSIEWEGTMFNVVDETNDNYLYPAEDFEIIEEHGSEKMVTGMQEKKAIMLLVPLSAIL